MIRLLSAGVALAISATLIGSLPSFADSSDHVPRPVITHDFPDPSVLQTDHGDYAYSTNSRYNGVLVNIPEATAPALAGPWTAAGVDALPNLPSWVQYDAGDATNDIWAPDVSRLDDGTFVMYYVAHNANGLQCVGAAKSITPAGPFDPVGDQPLLCLRMDYGNIDPAAYTEHGRHYLIYKDNANSAGIPNSIWINQIASDGVTFLGPRSKMLTADPAGNENNVAEGPAIIRHDGQYVLLYSADNWDSTYHMKYAVSDTLTGPYTKQGTFADTGTWAGSVVAPGGGYVVTAPDGTPYLFFHGAIGSPADRGMYVDRLTWPHGVPTLAGAPPLPSGNYTFTALTDGTTTLTAGRDHDWTVTAGPDGAYRIVSTRTHLALSAAGPFLLELPYFGAAGQLWYIDRDFDGYFRISSRVGHQLLTLDGSRLALTPNTDSPNQKWLPNTV